MPTIARWWICLLNSNLKLFCKSILHPVCFSVEFRQRVGRVPSEHIARMNESNDGENQYAKN